MTILTVLPVLLLLVAGAGGFDLGRKTGLQVDNTASAPLNRPYFCPPHVWCPRFEILNSTSGYETRQYSNVTLATALGTSEWSTSFAFWKAVKELAIYFAGPGNAEHERIPPTVPLTAGLPLHTHNDSDSHGHTKAVRAAAFLPPGYQGKDALEPSSKGVHIMESNDTTIFVSAFGGIAFPWTVVKETIRLAHALSNDGICLSEGFFTVALYSPPSLFANYNEVWFIKKANSTAGGSCEGVLEQTLTWASLL